MKQLHQMDFEKQLEELKQIQDEKEQEYYTLMLDIEEKVQSVQEDCSKLDKAQRKLKKRVKRDHDENEQSDSDAPTILDFQPLKKPLTPIEEIPEMETQESIKRDISPKVEAQEIDLTDEVEELPVMKVEEGSSYDSAADRAIGRLRYEITHKQLAIELNLEHQAQCVTHQFLIERINRLYRDMELKFLEDENGE